MDESPLYSTQILHQTNKINNLFYIATKTSSDVEKKCFSCLATIKNHINEKVCPFGKY